MCVGVFGGIFGKWHIKIHKAREILTKKTSAYILVV